MEIGVKDKKQKILYIAMLLLLARPGYINYLASGTTVRSLLSGLEVAVYLCIFLRWINNRRMSLFTLLSVLLCGLLALSTFLNGGSIGEVVRDYMGLIFMAMLMDAEAENKDALWQAIIFYLSVMIVIDCIVGLALPEGLYPNTYVYGDAVFQTHKALFFAGQNTVGLYIMYWMFFKAEYDLNKYEKLRPIFYIISVLSIITLFVMECLTSMLASIVMFVIMALSPLISKIKPGIFNVYLLMGIVALVNILFVVLDNIGSLSGYFITNVLGATTTFNGRTPAWRILLELLSNKPVLGNGYIREKDFRYIVAMPNVPHAHNYLLNIGTFGGLAAVIVLLIIIVLALKYIRKKQFTYSGIALTAFMFAFMVAMIFEIPRGIFYWLIFAYAFTLDRQPQESSCLRVTGDRLGWTLNI